MKHAKRVSHPAVRGAKEKAPAGAGIVHMIRLLALLALAVSALVYPLRLDTGLFMSLVQLAQQIPGGETLLRALEPYLEFGFSPLALKEALTSWVLLVVLALWLTWRLVLPVKRSGKFSPEFLCLILFFGWGLLSVRFAPGFGSDSHSTYTALNFTVWIFFLIALTDLPSSRRHLQVSAWWIMAVGLILMLISIGEAMKGVSDVVFRVMPRLDFLYKRNLYGSLIGHNTGVASICMGPFFLALGLLFHAKSWRARVALFAYVAISIYFFLVTESRAIWIFFLVLTPLFLLGLRPLIGSPIRLRHFAAGLALLLVFVGAQFFPAKWNILHIEDAPFISRLKAFTPAVLLSETRLRILAVTLPVVAQNPVFGQGLSSFVSIYPKAQGDYFANHPDSPLYPTFHLTEQAHDDYLQLLLETGLLGVALAGATVFFFFRRAWARFKRLKSPREKLLRYCAVFALGEIMLHAFVDFPFHVAPLATFFLFYCAMAYGSPDEDEAPASAPALGSMAATPRLPARSKILAFALVFAVWNLAMFGIVVNARRLKADVLLCRGLTYSSQAPGQSDPATTVKDLIARRELLRLALRVDPLENTAVFHRGAVTAQLAGIYSDQALSKDSRQDPRNAQAARSNALAYATGAIEDLCRAGGLSSSTAALPIDGKDLLGPRVNHTLLFNLARCWRVIGDLSADGRQEALRNAFNFYQLAVRYSPTYSEAVRDLIDFMYIYGIGSRQQRVHYLRIFATRDRPTFFARYVTRYITMNADGQYAQAESLLLDLKDAVKDRSDYPEIYELLVGYYMGADDAEKHRAAIAEMKAKYPSHPKLKALMIDDLVMRGKYAEALASVRELEKSKIPMDEVLVITKSELLAKAGQAQEARRLFEGVLRKALFPARIYHDRGMVRAHLFFDRKGAFDDFMKALYAYPVNVPATVFPLLVQTLIERGDFAKAQEVVTIGKMRYPTSPIVSALEAKLAPGSKRAAP